MSTFLLHGAHCGTAEGEAAVSTRPMSLRKETLRDRHWRWWKNGPLGWLWTCHICRLEATYPMDALADGYAEALDHLDEEHLAVSG